MSLTSSISINLHTLFHPFPLPYNTPKHHHHHHSYRIKQQKKTSCCCTVKTGSSSQESSSPSFGSEVVLGGKTTIVPKELEFSDDDDTDDEDEEGEEKEEKEENEENNNIKSGEEEQDRLFNPPPPTKVLSWEDQILQDTVPIVGFIRMVLHSGRYSMGERLSPVDERIILDRVLPYHPEFEQKIGCGVDYLTIGNHPEFVQSRCLFIVRKDATIVDFSYWKCIKAFIMKKYPLYAHKFILKHFRRTGRYG